MDRARNLVGDIYELLGEVPLIDIHTHLVGGHLGAEGLHDVLLYHMSISDLYAAGCPDGARLTQYPSFPDKQEAHTRLERATPFLKYVHNTAINWGVRIILKDLYGIEEYPDPDNWQRIDNIVREQGRDPAWSMNILRRINIRRIGSEWARRREGQNDDILQYALEWAFFTRCQWGEHDTALYELECAWGNTPHTPTPIGQGIRPRSERQITSLEEVHEAIHHYVAVLASLPVLSTATHLSTDLDFEPVSDSDMSQALKNRASAGPHERSVYAAYIHEAFLSEMEKVAPQIVFQFSFGAEPLPFETGSRLTQKSIAQLAEMINRHPGLRFQCFLASAHANQSLCTLARELPNLSLAGYWWHTFFPSIITRVLEERLDMLPANKQVGFFSDAYCIEWSYAKWVMVRRILAEVFAHKVSLGQYHLEDVSQIAQQILYETPMSLLGFKPAPFLENR